MPPENAPVEKAFSLTFWIQRWWRYFGKIIARGDNIPIVQYVYHFLEDFITDGVYWTHIFGQMECDCIGRCNTFIAFMHSSVYFVVCVQVAEWISCVALRRWHSSTAHFEVVWCWFKSLALNPKYFQITDDDPQRGTSSSTKGRVRHAAEPERILHGRGPLI